MEGPLKWLRKGAWSAEEDILLRQCIDKYGEGKWHRIPLRAGLNRCRKSCRLRWLNYLKPNIKKGKFSADEVDLLLRLHKLLGNRWSLIAGRLPGRTGNDVKNYWNTNMGRKQEPCCKNKTRKTYITFSNTTPAQKLDIIRHCPRSLSVNNVNDSNWLNGLPEIDHVEVNNLMVGKSVWWENLLEESQETDVLNSKATATEKEETLADSSLFKSTSSTFYDEKTDKFVNNLMDGESMWWESLLEESQETDVLDSKTENGETTADSSLFNSISSAFDVEELWSMFEAETGKLE